MHFSINIVIGGTKIGVERAKRRIKEIIESDVTFNFILFYCFDYKF